MSKPTKPQSSAATKSEPKFETFYRMHRKSMYEFELQEVQVDVSSSEVKVLGHPDIRRVILDKLSEKFD